jgi:hypothetical protein
MVNNIEDSDDLEAKALATAKEISAVADRIPAVPRLYALTFMIPVILSKLQLSADEQNTLLGTLHSSLLAMDDQVGDDQVGDQKTRPRAAAGRGKGTKPDKDMKAKAMAALKEIGTAIDDDIPNPVLLRALIYLLIAWVGNLRSDDHQELCDMVMYNLRRLLTLKSNTNITEH